MTGRVSIRKIAFAGVLAALYAALTMALGEFGYGPVQFRIAEALCILPFFFPFTVWGLFVGCIIANIISPFFLDIILGPTATLLAALCTMWLGKLSKRQSVPIKALACFPPVIFNALIIGAMIAYLTMGDQEPVGFAFAFSFVGLGQLVVMYGLGLPLMIYLPKIRAVEKLNELYGGSL